LQKEDYESSVSNRLITTDIRQLNFKLIKKPRKKKSKLSSRTWAGFGYSRGVGVKNGIEIIILSKAELSFSFLDTSPLTSVPYSNFHGIGATAEFGFRINKPIVFYIHGGYGIRTFINNDNTNETISFRSAIVGLTLPIRLSSGFGLYLKADYWLHTENGAQLAYSLGIMF